MNRDEHLKWSKERALAYLPGGPVQAMTSMLLDLREHPELRNHPGRMIAPMFYGDFNSPAAVRRWIEGFN